MSRYLYKKIQNISPESLNFQHSGLKLTTLVFDPIFYDEMMGFRPNRGCHKAIRKLNLMLERKPTNYVLDADIKGFFQHLDHEWIIRFIGSRIIDPNIIRLVRRMLKAGIMNNYEFEETEEGSGQGSVCSPVISCIYMALRTGIVV